MNKKYKNYIGKYYERITGNNDYCVYQIESFNGKYFLVTEYYLSLGYSTKEIHQRKSISFITAKNFKEISKERYDLVRYLCIEPFVTIYDNDENPHYYREFKSNSRIIINKLNT